MASTSSWPSQTLLQRRGALDEGTKAMARSLAERFEEKVDRTGEHHLWLGATNPDRGTGRLKVAGRNMTAHRVAWEIEHGEAPPGTKVLPCRVEPRCVRPDHLTVEHTTSGAVQRSARGGGSKREVGPGTWELAASAGIGSDGKPKRVFRRVTGTKQEAARALAALVAEVGDGRDVPDRSQKGVTVKQLLDGYLDHLRDHKGRRHSTLVRYGGLAERWIAPHLGSRVADRVLPDDVERALGVMRAAGQSQSSIHQTFTLLNGTFKWARRNRVISRNPMIEAEEPRSTAIRREVIPPDIESLLRLLAAAKDVDAEFGLLAHLGAVTGMRRGELAGLRWRAVDLEAERIEVATTVNDAGGTVVITDTTKTGKPRLVGIDAHTVGMLRSHRRGMEERAAACGTVLVEDAFVASRSPDGSLPVRPEQLSRKMLRLRRRLGMDAANFDATMHALRHWAQTTLTEAGFDSRQIADRGGHTEALMKSVYIHRTDESEQRMTSHLGSLLATPPSTPEG